MARRFSIFLYGGPSYIGRICCVVRPPPGSAYQSQAYVLGRAAAICDVAINDQRCVSPENKLAAIAELELTESRDVRAEPLVSIDRVCSGDNPLSDRAFTADRVLGFNGSPDPFGRQCAAYEKG